MPPKGLAGYGDEHVPLRWDMDDAGDISMMRIGAMIAIIAACAIVAVGLVLACVSISRPAWSQSTGPALVASGVGLFLSALGFKALQRQAEAKIQ